MRMLNNRLLLIRRLSLITLITLITSSYVFNKSFVSLFSVGVKERQDILSTMYWLPKLHKRPYKARSIANSSSCNTTELSKLFPTCLKFRVSRYYETVYERSWKICFGL